MPRARGRLARPYIPLAVRVRVAERMFDAMVEFPTPVMARNAQVFRDFVDRDHWKRRVFFAEQLSVFLRMMFADAKVELHHRPALLNRVRKGNDYDPPANDPAHLVYLAEAEHDVETRIRGQHGQHSDLALARKLKRMARTRAAPTESGPKFKRPIAKIPSRPFPKGRGFQKRTNR